MNANNLIEKCENILKVGWNPYKYFKLVLYSFRGDFKKIRENLTFELDKNEVNKFIEICDNRAGGFKTFLSVEGVVLGFFITGTSIILSIASKAVEQKIPIDPIWTILFTDQYGIAFRIFFVFLLACIIFLFVLLLHYRTHLHAWTAFKEAAILSEKYSPKEK